MTETQFGYGLRIRSNVAVPGLVGYGPTGEHDVELKLGELPEWVNSSEVGRTELYYEFPRREGDGREASRVLSLRDGRFFLFHYADDTRFLVSREGDRIWASWVEPFTLADAATYLLGPVLGLVLRLRGFAVLHGSAVEVDGNAIAFVGVAGSGKSTIAAWFVSRGYNLVADDNLVLHPSASGVHVVPTYPRIRLWPSSVSMLFDSREALPPLTPNWDKRFLDALPDGAPWRAEPLPLALVCFLNRRDSNEPLGRVEQLTGSAALLAAISQGYVNYLLTGAMGATQFEIASRVVREVECRSLHPSSDPSALNSLCEAVLAEVSSLPLAVPHSEGAAT